MKLSNIKPVYEQFENDHSAAANKAMGDQQMQLAFNAVKSKELDKAEIRDLSKELADNEKFGRTVGSAEFILSRMHILVHGSAPHGETQNRAETMFGIPKTMINFADKKGYDTFENISSAKRDLKGRAVRVKEQVAKEMMFKFYKDNKDSLPKDINTHREDIIKMIMAGTKPVDAFKKFS